MEALKPAAAKSLSWCGVALNKYLKIRLPSLIDREQMESFLQTTNHPESVTHIAVAAAVIQTCPGWARHTERCIPTQGQFTKPHPLRVVTSNPLSAAGCHTPR